MLQGVLSFVIVRPVLALVQILCMATNRFGEDEFTFTRGWLWCMLINNVTQARPWHHRVITADSRSRPWLCIVEMQGMLPTLWQHVELCALTSCVHRPSVT